MKKFILQNQKFTFPIIAVISTLVICVVFFEISAKLLEKHFLYVTADLNMVKTDKMKEGGLLKKNFNGYVIDSLGNDILWVNNSDGFRNQKEFQRKPDSSSLRILSVGGSFTAGYRVPQSKTFSFLMEKWIKKKFGKTDVMVAWTQQPALVLKYIDDFGRYYYPDIIFLGITMGDITQIYNGLGTGRDLKSWKVPDNCIKKRNLFEEAKWISNFIYSRSRFVGLFYDQPRAVSSRDGAYRSATLFDFHHAIGFFMNSLEPPVKEAYDELFDQLVKLKNFLDTHNIKLILSLFPQRFQISKNDWKILVYEYGLQESCFDLSLPTILFSEFCKNNDIFCLDAALGMKKFYVQMKTNFYQPRGDTHWNALGNQFYLESIKPELNKYLEGSKGGFWATP